MFFLNLDKICIELPTSFLVAFDILFKSFYVFFGTFCGISQKPPTKILRFYETFLA
jgi:hypothetical protein